MATPVSPPVPAASDSMPFRGFVVADIPEPFESRIQSIRDRLGTVTARLPVEITLAGSSGLGPIPQGTDLGLVRSELTRITDHVSAFSFEFGPVSHFPGTGVFFLPPGNRGPFDALHALLAASKIPFTRSPHPYNPHCTLRSGPEVDAIASERIRSIPVPSGEVPVNSLSLYTLDGRTLTASLVHRVNLKR